MGVFDLRVAVAVVIVVAQHRPPGHLQRGRGVNFFKGILPVRVGHGGHAVLVEIVADGDDELRLHLRAADAHLFGDRRLVRLASAAPVAQQEEIQRAGFRLGGEQFLRQPRPEGGGLGGDEQGADELAAGLFHG